MIDRPPELTIIVPGPPRTERKRQVRMGEHAARVDVKDRVEYKAVIRLQAAAAMQGREPLEGPLAIRFLVMRLKPGQAPKCGWRPTGTDPWPLHWWRKPDLGNYLKLFADACSKIVWLDDAQIVMEANVKLWGGEEGIGLQVWRLEWTDALSPVETLEAALAGLTWGAGEG